MKQSRGMSLVEASANVAIGYGVAVVAQLLAFPMLGVQVSLAQNLKLGLVFTGVSLLRSYTLRRAFERLRSQSIGAARGASPR